MMIEQDAAQEQLPREPWTLLRSLTRHARMFVLFAILAVATGALVSRTVVHERYAAEAVLLFTPGPGDDRGAAPPRLESRRDMVKVLPNLREVIRRLGLHVTPAKLGSAVDARLRRDSNVLAVEVQWSDPKKAADIANELSTLFLEQQTTVRRAAMKQLVADLERQQARGREELKKAADELGRFRQERGALSLDDQIRTAIAEVSSLQSQLDQVTVERDNLRRQRANLPEVVRAVSKQLSGGQLGTTGVQPESQAREAARLRGAIEDARRAQERATNLAGAKAQLERVKRLTTIGLLPLAELQKAELEHRKAHEAAVDTPRIAEWRERAESIDRKLEGTQNGAPTTLGSEVGFRSFQIELDSVAIEDKKKYLEDALARAKAQLQSYAPLQRAMFDLQAETSRQERELATLEEPLTRARRAAASDTSEFQLVSKAQVDPTPVTRRRLLAFGGIAGGLMALFAGLVLLRELTENRVRSGRELAYLSRLPVFAQVVDRPRPWRAEGRLDQLESDLDLMTRLSRRIEQAAPDGTPRVMITGSVSPAVRRRVVDGLLAQYILQGRRVAWISLVETDRDEGSSSIHDYLRGDGPPAERLLDTQPSDAVALIGGSAAVAPHLRANARMRDLVRRAADSFDLVLVIGDSLTSSPDELALARECNVVVLLAEAGKTTHEEASYLARLTQDAGLSTTGWLLAGVSPEFGSLTTR